MTSFREGVREKKCKAKGSGESRIPPLSLPFPPSFPQNPSLLLSIFAVNTTFIGRIERSIQR